MESTGYPIFTFFLLCVIPLGIGLIIVLGIRGLPLSKRGIQSIIQMDGANCVQTDDGSIIIKRRALFTWLVVVFMALFPLCILWLTVDRLLRQGLKVEDLRLIPVILIFAVLIFAVTRPLRMPSLQFKASAGMLEIGRGTSPRQIPFSSVSYIATIPDSGPLKVTVIQILAVLKDKEIIPIGNVSGDEKKAHSRATAVAQLLANILGVEVRQELHSGEKEPQIRPPTNQ